MLAELNIPEIITASTALVAVFIGPFLTYCYTTRQATSAMREKWLNDLRDQIKDLIAQAEEITGEIIQHRILNKELNSKYRKLVDSEVKIRLMLTGLTDEHHKKLGQKVSELVKLAGNEKIQAEEKQSQLFGLKDEIIAEAQIVLKDAWKQVLSH